MSEFEYCQMRSNLNDVLEDYTWKAKRKSSLIFTLQSCQMADKNLLFINFNSGLSPRHQLLLQFFAEQGWNVTILLWDRSLEDSRIRLTSIKGARVLRIHLPAPTWSARIVKYLPALYGRMKREVCAIESPVQAVVLTHYFHLPFLYMHSFGNAKVLYDAAEMYAIDLSYYFPRFRVFFEKALALVERFMVQRVDGVLTVDSRGGFLADHYKKSGAPVQTLWNVPSKLDDPGEAEITALRQTYSGRRTIAFVGGMMREKGLLIALEAAALVTKRCDNAMFLFIGRMKDNCEEIEALIRESRILNNIRILPHMPYRHMMAHLSHCEIGLALHQQQRIYSFVSAGNGRKFFTYMQAGLAIIGPRFGEVGKAVQLADCGMLVDTEDPGAVAEAILELLGSPEKLGRFKQNARNAFVNKYNWEIEQSKLSDFLGNVLGNHPFGKEHDV